MKISVCNGCGALFDFNKLKKCFGNREDYYGEFGMCPICFGCVYEEENSKVDLSFFSDLTIEETKNIKKDNIRTLIRKSKSPSIYSNKYLSVLDESIKDWFREVLE